MEILLKVTSGTQSPSSGKSIALAMIKRDEFEMGRVACSFVSVN